MVEKGTKQIIFHMYKSIFMIQAYNKHLKTIT